MSRGINGKHQAFINEYLHCWNATAAYQHVYQCSYESANANGSKLLANTSVFAEIQRRIEENAMSANEVLARLAEHARGDIDDVLSASGELDIEKARLNRKTRLIKKITNKRCVRIRDDESTESAEVTVELYDAQSALVQIGKNLRLFSDKQEIEHTLKNAHIPIAIVQPGYMDLLKNGSDNSRSD